jgi:hypothetical protein
MITSNTLSLLRSISKVTINKDEKQLLFDNLSTFENPELIDLLEKHKIKFLFYKHLYDSGFLVDDHYYKYLFSLGEQFVYLQYKYSEYLSALKPILENLNSNGIPYTLLKGFSLIDPIYKVSGKIFRSFNDADILISKKDIPYLNQILKSNGFVQAKINNAYQFVPINKAEKIYWSLNSHQEHEYIKPSQNFNFAPHLNLNIDVNFSIFQGGKYKDPISTNKLLNNCRKRSVEGIVFYSLDYTYELIQLCFHFYKDLHYDVKIKAHEDFNLIKFCDINEYINLYIHQIDWDKFFLLLKDNNLYQEIGTVLYFVGSFYNNEKIKQIINKFPNKIEFEINWKKLL